MLFFWTFLNMPPVICVLKVFFFLGLCPWIDLLGGKVCRFQIYWILTISIICCCLTSHLKLNGVRQDLFFLWILWVRIQDIVEWLISVSGCLRPQLGKMRRLGQAQLGLESHFQDGFFLHMCSTLMGIPRGLCSAEYPWQNVPILGLFSITASGLSDSV